MRAEQEVMLDSFRGKRDVKAIMLKGYPKPDTPTTYKRLQVVGHNIGNAYNPHIMVIYEAQDKSLRYEIYRDGCFWAFYGKIII